MFEFASFAIGVICFLLNTSALEISPGDQDASSKVNAGQQFQDMFPLTKDNFSSEVLNERDPWIVLFHDGTLSTSWAKLAETSRGIIWFGLINKKEQSDLLYDMGIYPTKIPTARLYPAGGPVIKRNNWRDVSSPNEAKAKALNSIPDETTKVNSKNLQTFVINSHLSKPSRFPALYITTEAEVPGFIKAIAVHFKKYYSVGVMINPSSDDLQMLGSESSFLDLPTFMTLLTVEDKIANAGHINAIPFKTKTMGYLDYPNIAKYLFAVNQQYRHLLPGNNMSNQKQEAEMEDVAKLESKRFDISKTVDNSNLKQEL